MTSRNRHYNREVEKRQFRRVVVLEPYPQNEPIQTNEIRSVELPIESNEGFVLRREEQQLMFEYQEPRSSY